MSAQPGVQARTSTNCTGRPTSVFSSNHLLSPLTRILQAEVRFGLAVPLVHNLLAYVLGQDLVEHVVDRQSEPTLVYQQFLHQQAAAGSTVQ